MKLSQFNFKIPINLIAQRPLPKKEQAKMMVVHRDTGKMESRRVKNLPDYFDEGDALIINNTRVLNSRLIGRKEKTDHKIDVVLLRELSREQKIWDAIVSPARKMRMGNKIFFGEESNEFIAEIIDNTTSRGRTIKFLSSLNTTDFKALLKREGQILLPSYIKQQQDPQSEVNYQTFFGKRDGSIVAPFAGLHLTPFILKKFEANGIHINEVTAHNGLANRNAIEVEDLNRYKIEVSYHQISERTAQLINYTKKRNNRVCALGVSTLRSIESSLNTKDEVMPVEGMNKLFLHPPYKFKVADMLFCNFNMPKTLFHVAALSFSGKELMDEAYQKAVKEKYRFFAYGDAMLIL